MSKISIHAERLQGRIDTLAGMTVPDRPWERTAFSDLHRQARDYLTGEMRGIGLETSIDAAGNLIGRIAGQQQGLAPIAVGSHSDTVPRGGRYDGVAGVVVALEIAETIKETGYRLRHPLEVIDFLGEEPNKYGLSCVGSRGIAGLLSQEMLGYQAPDGSTLAEGIRQMGGDPDELGRPLRRPGETAAFLEMHIEQARVLESAGEDVGSVTDIVGIARIEFSISGMADHAGATPMDLRKDALTGAAQAILDFELRAKAETSCSMVATMGKLRVLPNASNAVPGLVEFTLEVRSNNAAALGSYIAWAQTRVASICKSRSLEYKAHVIGKSEPVQMADHVHQSILNAARMEGYKARSMPSGAGHDAAYMAMIAPTGMTFIPCLEGRSHCPEEFATPEQLAKGAQTMLNALLDIDDRLN